MHAILTNADKEGRCKVHEFMLFDRGTEKANMERHGHPRDQVESAVRESGDRGVEVQENGSAGPDFESFFGLVSR